MESKIRDLRQEIFKFEQLSNFDKNDFFVSECNYFAFNLIKSWPNWEKKILNVYGERKSGKSHLSEIFLENKNSIKFEFKEMNKKDGTVIFKNNINPLGYQRKLLLIRGFLGTVALFCIFKALTILPIATATVIQYSYPTFTVICAFFFLKEYILKRIIYSI